MILCTLHLGASTGLGRFLEELPGEVLVLRATPPQPHRKTTSAKVGLNEWERVASTKRALDVLRSAGFVCLAADGWGRSSVAVTLVGRRITLCTGPFALARMAGAPIVPVAARWQGARMAIVAGEPIEPQEESAMAAAFAQWFDDYLRANPREARPRAFKPRLPGQLPARGLQQRPKLGVPDLAAVGSGNRLGWEDGDVRRRETHGSDDFSGDLGGYLLG